MRNSEHLETNMTVPQDQLDELAETLQAEVATLAISELVGRLADALGSNVLVSTIGGAANPRDSYMTQRWQSGAKTPSPPSLKQLRAGLVTFRLLERAESADLARTWFIGDNPRLGKMPALALREGQCDLVLAVAKAYTTGCDN
jgi:hypothetical protein